MQNAEKLHLLNQKYPQLKNVKNETASTLKKVAAWKTLNTISGFTLLRRFLKELEASNNTFLRDYNREVI